MSKEGKYRVDVEIMRNPCVHLYMHAAGKDRTGVVACVVERMTAERRGLTIAHLNFGTHPYAGFEMFHLLMRIEGPDDELERAENMAKSRRLFGAPNRLLRKWMERSTASPPKLTMDRAWHVHFQIATEDVSGIVRNAAFEVLAHDSSFRTIDASTEVGNETRSVPWFVMRAYVCSPTEDAAMDLKQSILALRARHGYRYVNAYEIRPVRPTPRSA